MKRLYQIFLSKNAKSGKSNFFSTGLLWGRTTVDKVHSHTWIRQLRVRSVGRRDQIKFPTRTFHSARAAGF